MTHPSSSSGDSPSNNYYAALLSKDEEDGTTDAFADLDTTSEFLEMEKIDEEMISEEQTTSTMNEAEFPALSSPLTDVTPTAQHKGPRYSSQFKAYGTRLQAKLAKDLCGTGAQKSN